MWFRRRRTTAPTGGDAVRAAEVARDDAGRGPGAGALWADGFGRIGTRSVQVLALLALLTVAVLAITRLTLVVVPVLIALVLASAIHPLVSWLRRTGCRRSPPPGSRWC